MHGDECARDGPLLLQLVGLPRRPGQDAALGDEHHVLAGKLLLQLAHNPRLNLLKHLQFRHWHEDDDCPSAASAAARCTDVDLWTLKRDRV